MDRAVEALSRLLGHRFADTELLAEALTHPSAPPRRGRARGGYERLEFLGDRVLGLVVAEMLYHSFPDEPEGALARRHAALVKRDACARVAAAIGLGAALVLSRGEDEGGGRTNPATLGDACEAVIGAMYADGGLGPAAAFVRRYWQPLMDENVAPPKDAKTALQEWAQSLGKPLPGYEVAGVDGPAHDPTFLVSVRVTDVDPATGRGPTKRAAEQAAALAMLEKVKK